MNHRIWLILGSVLALCGAAVGLAADLAETEPNDNPASANPINAADVMNGAVDPVGDVDYFAQPGVNATWGYIALIDTSGSATSQSGTLAALGSDGATVLQADTGSWERGSGIALQNFADGGETHYLRVEEEGGDATISEYALRYYETVVASQPESEPNDTLATGTPSGFTHDGILSAVDDRDCYQFHGRLGDTILVALNGDPEGDGSPADPSLDLVNPDDTVIKLVNVSGLGGMEFLEYADLPTEGVYAYCVRLGSGVGDSNATYKIGLVRNGFLYYPAYEQGPEWLNPGPGNTAQVGDILTFRLVMSNLSPVTIPGGIDLTASYSDECLAFLNADPAPTSESPGYLAWQGLQPELGPEETFSVDVSLEAVHSCVDVFHQGTQLPYYFTGAGNEINFTILTRLFLPLTIDQE
jgi:hypothetical protein